MSNTLIQRITIIIIFPILILTIRIGDGNSHEQIVSNDLTGLTLGELSEIEVTTVSKKKQKLSEAASAVFVITQEDIRRSGVTSIPEALRMVPGLQVARIDSNRWAVSSRGFNDQFANKLLVMVDGRSIYTPMFSGVRWEIKDTLLEDIERIEVVRGPGASLWGANAVNGVINIVTKNAENTQGGLAIVGGGSDERGFGGIRYGGTLGENAFYRVYAKYFNRDSFVDGTGHDAADGWEQLRGGFRVDWNASETDNVTFLGSAYSGKRGHKEIISSLSPPFENEIDLDSDTTGGHILSRWMHTFSDTSDMAFHFYYDRTEWDDETYWEIRDTFDIDFQHRFALGKFQEIVWGFGYRFTTDDLNNRHTISFDPESKGDNLFSTFILDEFKLFNNQLRLTLGSKFEHNDYTGFEFQPNARIIWTPNDKHSVWTALSRAVRTPSRIENDGRGNSTVVANPLIPDGPPILLSLFGDHDVEPEDLFSFEIGYRFKIVDTFSIDIATFYNVYDHLRTLEPGNPFIEATPAPLHLLIPVNTNNKMSGETYGIEIAANWQVLEWWQIKSTYTYLDMELHLDNDSKDVLSEGQEKQSPENQFTTRSIMNLPWNLELDTLFRYVDNLSDLDTNSYINLDFRLGWKPKDAIEISIVGQNLLNCDHKEFDSTLFNIRSTEVERGVYGSIKWQF